jgi:hypothetical protein
MIVRLRKGLNEYGTKQVHVKIFYPRASKSQDFSAMPETMTGFWLSPIMPFAAALAGALVSGLLVRAAARAAADRNGWRHIRPGAWLWSAVILSAALLCGMLYARLVIGPTRADLAFQMQILSVMIAATGFGLLTCLWQARAILRARVQWRDGEIARVTPSGELLVHPLTKITHRSRDWNGTIRLRFSDGSAMKLDRSASGAAELWQRLAHVSD